MKNFKFQILFLLFSAAFLTTSCNNNDEEVLVPAPTSENASFSFSYDPMNANKVNFVGQANVETWYTHWDFGDNFSGEGNEVSRIYPLSGEYEVRFKIFTEGGSAFSTQMISIENDLIGPNLVQNGTFDNEDAWTILPISGGVEVTFENDGALFSGGGWGHEGIYQQIEIEGNKLYQIDLEVRGGGANECWFEVYVGSVMPMAGVDYTDGGMRLGLSTWDGCGTDPFDGLLSLLSCSNNAGDGTFQFTEDQNVYLVIRSGGGTLGDEGIFVDNVSVRSIE